MSVLRFAHTFSNGATGTISLDLRKLCNGVYLIAPCIRGVEPAPVDECEAWMRDVLSEVVTRMNKEARIVGQSGMLWELRPDCQPECGGTAFLAREEFMRRIIQSKKESSG